LRSVNGTAAQKKSRSHTTNGAENATSDHDESDDDKEDEVAAGENGASGGQIQAVLHGSASN
jgi:hypothetical protein